MEMFNKLFGKKDEDVSTEDVSIEEEPEIELLIEALKGHDSSE